MSSQTPSRAICTDLQNDNLHCGACDVICTGGLACAGGRCGPCSHTTIPGGAMLLDFGTKPSSPLIADLDNDGVLDLVALSASENSVTLRLGNGDGSFSDSLAYATGKTPSGVAVGDFDGDDQPDLAVANTGSRDLVVLLGIPGARRWRESQRLALSSLPLALATGDLDQDGRADLVVGLQGAASGELLIRRGSMDETRSEPVVVPLLGTPSGLVLTDLNGDSRPDFVVSLQEGSVAVALTGADGNPGPMRRYGAGPGCAAVVAMDLNSDSRLDLVASSTGDSSLRVLLGQGDGSFAEAVRYALDGTPAGLFSADIDGDGKPDVLTGAPAEHSVRVLPGLGNGALGPSKKIAAGPSPVEIRVADLNRDGIPDLVAAHAKEKGHALSILLARDAGVYSPRTQALVDSPFALRLADLDGDGQQDVVLLGAKLSVLRGGRDGSFAPATVYDLGGAATVDLQVLDLDQDSRPDVAVATSKALMLFFNDGAGRLTGPKTVSTGATLNAFAAGDTNHDGRPDFAVDHNSGIDVLLATAGGDYQAKTVAYSACGCDFRPSMRFAELNLDGHSDLLTLSGSSNAVLDAWMGDGMGGFTRLGTTTSAAGKAPRILAVTQAPQSPGVVLLDRGGPDSASMVMGWIARFRSPGDGTTRLLSQRPLDGLLGDGALVDIDHDGLLDAIVPLTAPAGFLSLDARQRVRPEDAQKTDNSVAILRNQLDGGLVPWLAYWLESPASAVGAADLNGDGGVDIVVAHDSSPALTVLLTKVTPCR